MTDSKTARKRDLLRAAIEKQQALHRIPEWQRELVPRSLPVLWFGDSQTSKDRVVTLGANPSRSEFLSRKRGDSQPALLESPRNRFHTLGVDEDLAGFLGNADSIDRTLQGFDSYFRYNPYRTWFGKPEGGKVEGLINGMDASFYDGPRSHSGLHIDLFPFATITDFTQIASTVSRDLFADRWAHGVVTELLAVLVPSAIVITGKSNLNHVTAHFPDLIQWTGEEAYISAPGRGTTIHRGTLAATSVPVTAITLNLGNPTGWSASDLRALGKHISSTSN